MRFSQKWYWSATERKKEGTFKVGVQLPHADARFLFVRRLCLSSMLSKCDAHIIGNTISCTRDVFHHTVVAYVLNIRLNTQGQKEIIPPLLTLLVASLCI